MTRWLRRLAFVLLIGFLWSVALGVIAAAANAATPTTTPDNWLEHVPVPYLAGILIGAGVIPILSALATSHPGALTGLLTVALSLLDAVLTAVAHAGNDSWTHVAGAAVSTWLLAAAVHSKILKKRDANDQPIAVEGLLHAHGYTGRHRPTVRSSP